MPTDATPPRFGDAAYRLLVESVTDYAIFFLDPEGVVRTWNPGAQRIKGFLPVEIIGRHFSAFYRPEDAKSGLCERELEIARSEGRFEDIGWRVRKDGSLFWAHVVITAVRDESGALIGYGKVTKDLTDRAYRAFVEATNAMVWSTDATGQPISDSPGWRAFTGQTEQEWFNRRAWDPVHPDDLPELRRAWPRARAQKTKFEAEFRLRRADGEYVWMAARAVPFFQPDGSVREWFGVTFDISQRKQAELERERALSSLKTTLESIGDAVIAADTDGRITFMNPVAETLTGWSAKDARGVVLSEVFNIVNEDTRRPVESPVDKVLREGTIVGLANHTVLVRPDGTDLPIDDSAAPIRDRSGKLFGVVLVFRDVSREKLAQVRRDFLARAGDALIRALDYRESLTTVAQLAVPRLADWTAVSILEPGGVVPQQLAFAHVDPSKVAYAKELARKYPPDPNATSGVANVIRTGRSEIYSDIPRELLERAAVDEEHMRMLEQLQLRSAMMVPLRGRERVFGALTFVYAESGRKYGADDLVVAEELARRAAIVIERRKLEDERRELLERERDARTQAEQANRAKDEFLATVSHELRNPLNVILGWAKILMKRELPEEAKTALETIERNARTQARLIEDVLEVSRIVSGKLHLDLGPADVEQAVRDAIESVKPLAATKNVVLTADTPPGLDAHADQVRLQQIVANLVSNAVKFTPSGGSVAVAVTRVPSGLRIVVRDDGEGIEPALLSAIFEPFRQADSSSTRRHGGLGLGLAIVQKLVHAHGGTVRAESEGKGRGATFIVELPTHAGAKRSDSSRPPATPNRQIALPGTRVLVVDDEIDAAELLQELLEDAGAKVATATTARAALQKLRTFRPEVLVTDLGMPEVDGYGLLREIRKLSTDEGGRTPAIALSAYTRREDAARAFSAGFQTHVPKPVDPEQLLRLVANLAGLPLDAASPAKS